MDDYGDTLDALATWTAWLPMNDIRTQINPAKTGVYIARYEIRMVTDYLRKPSLEGATNTWTSLQMLRRNGPA